MVASNEMKHCVMCAEPIRFKATKCKHCGSYQHWLGRISVISTVLSLVIALISVIGLTAPAMKDFLTPSGAALRFSQPEFSRGSVSVTVTNYGAMPASVGVAFITVPQKSMGQPYIFDLQALVDGESPRIEPGETKQITYLFDRKKFDAPKLTSDDEPCSLEIYDQFKNVSCDEIRFLASKDSSVNNRKGLLPEEGPQTLSPATTWHRY